MITRSFHPIGQGAFYSEEHDDRFIMVYDCGNLYRTIQSRKVVSTAFPKGSIIDVLFISHFDADHVNLIDILKDRYHIKRVVLPLLDRVEEAILISIYRTMGYSDLINLISNPQRYFGNNTKIIKVMSGNGGQETSESISLENYSGDTIRSLTRLDIRSHLWCFIPFNYEFSEKHKKLLLLFEKEGIDVNNLYCDLDFIASKYKKIQKIYEKVDKDINKNSMLLYSGPINKINTYLEPIHSHCLPTYSKHCKRYNSAGCLYSGDSNWNIIDVKKIYHKYWDYVRTIQIPHHGSEYSFSIKPITGAKKYLCPMSYGKNKFGHPSVDVVKEMKSHHNYPIAVSDDPEYIFKEKIDIAVF
ncbi:MAG: hypothetical protein LBM77_05615 [Spirochaetaceae bacterium]|jgi:hypothetical protein|nr:hypothetical protein [Spirochaetaceae bacterium]